MWAKKGQLKEKGEKPTQCRKDENQDALTSDVGENVNKDLEMRRIMRDPTIKGPVGDLEDSPSWGDATKLALKGKSFIRETPRTQSFEKARTAILSLGRLHGGSGVGICARRNDL